MPAQRQNTGGKRFYVWGRGERYWSVTTILGALPKDALKWWAAKTVAEFAVDRSKTWFTMERAEAVEWLKREPLRYTNERADLGSAIHAAAEGYVLSKPLRGDFGDEERQAIGHFLRFVDELRPKWILSEASVFHRSQKYAGTLDAVVDIAYDRLLELAGGNPYVIPWEPPEGRPVRLLLDYKTGGDVAEGKGVYPEVALQLAAYGRAEFVGMPNGQEVPMPAVDGAAVLHVNASGWRLVPVDAMREEVWRSFLYVREVFRWREVISKEVLGTPLEPAVVEELRDASQDPPTDQEVEP